jgi:acyl carrier protein
MTDQEIRAKLIEIIKKEAKLDEADFLQGQPLAGLIDSLTLLEVVCQVEDEFGLEIEDEQIPDLKTFDDVVKGVTQLLSAQ